MEHNYLIMFVHFCQHQLTVFSTIHLHDTLHYSPVVLVTGLLVLYWYCMQSTGTWIFSCNKVRVVKKKIFFHCWDAVFSHSGVILRSHRGRMLNKLLSNLEYLKCNKSLLPYWPTDWTGGVSPHFVIEVHSCSNCSFFKYERYHNFYFVQLQCNWVPIIYTQYLYCCLKAMYWYLYWHLDHWYWYFFVEYLIQDCYTWHQLFAV